MVSSYKVLVPWVRAVFVLLSADQFTLPHFNIPLSSAWRWGSKTFNLFANKLLYADASKLAGNGKTVWSLIKADGLWQLLRATVPEDTSCSKASLVHKSLIYWKRLPIWPADKRRETIQWQVGNHSIQFNKSLIILQIIYQLLDSGHVVKHQHSIKCKKL